LNKQSASEGFWNNNENAQTVLKERARLESVVNDLGNLERDISDFADLVELAREEQDDSMESDLANQIRNLEKRTDNLETSRLLGNPMDSSDAYISFSAGAGGVDSADWTEMLLRMISRYCEKRGFKVSVVDILGNPEGGIKNATILVQGNLVYGYLRSERGIHRLVRISPYDAAARRHTSFAAIDVLPDAGDEIEIEIKEDDIRMDTYRAGGHGGQHVNKTDSAVRITHIPSGIVVQCQNERSQHKNRAQAMSVLKARLYEAEQEKKRKEIDERNSDKKGISWGSQIRSYVLAPYRLVKDTRTGVETGNVEAVLDGDLDRFVRAYLLATSEN